jgi:hypothetical protein
MRFSPKLRAVALAAATGLILGLPAVASAQTLPSRVTLESLATGYVVDSNPYGAVYPLPRNGGAYQKWAVIRTQFGTVNLRSLGTGRCLDSNPSGDVYTLPCNGGSYQKWIVEPSRFGSVVLRNLATGFVLDGDAQSIYTLSANGGSYQSWIPIAV